MTVWNVLIVELAVSRPVEDVKIRLWSPLLPVTFAANGAEPVSESVPVFVT